MPYGELPLELGVFKIKCDEMLFYQYIPIKLADKFPCIYEQRLICFSELIDTICADFISDFGIKKYLDSYVYLTAKHLYQTPNNSFNRKGYHSDGFLTNDINYIWYDTNPTIFNTSNFNLNLDDKLSLMEMAEQANVENDISFNENTLLRLDQFNIHRVADTDKGGMRTFIKVSFSKDKYDLIGNSHNYHLDYNWKMVERKVERNIPQSELPQKNNI